MKDDKPAEDTQNQVENEEWSENHQTDKINPGQLEPNGIIHLHTQENITSLDYIQVQKVRHDNNSLTPFYPVEDVSPSLHSDALEHGQHGKEEVVEVSDSPIGTVPPPPTLCAVNDALTTVTGKCTRHRVILHIIIWKTTDKVSDYC